MKRISVLLVLVLCTTSLFAADVKKALREKADAFEAALRAGNADEMAAMYADDAILMAPNAPAAKGKAAIRGHWAGLIGMVDKANLNVTIEDVSVHGNTAIERGTWKVAMMPKGSTMEMSDGGSYIIVWQNRGGKWQAVSDIYNSEKPLPQ